MKLIRKVDSEVLFSDVIRAESYFVRLIGLMGKKDFPENSVMWFTKCSSIQTCFMHFAIDCVFIDSDGKVLKVYHEIKPWRMTSPVWGATDAIEMKAGLAKAKNIKVGDVIRCGP